MILAWFPWLRVKKNGQLAVDIDGLMVKRVDTLTTGLD